MHKPSDVGIVWKMPVVIASPQGCKDRQERLHCGLIFGPRRYRKSFAVGCLGFENGPTQQRL